MSVLGMRVRPFLGVCLVGLSSPLLEARFSHTDARKIDAEQKLGTEFYNDVVSYQFPLRWERLWKKSPVGYRIRAGSLSTNRFLLFEEIKFDVTPRGAWGFSFEQKRKENLLKQVTKQKLAISYLPNTNWKLSLLGDGSTFKKWGDMGFEVGFARPGLKTSIAYWSVDHFYNTKEEIETDRYVTATKTMKAKLETKLGDLAIKAEHEHDTPLHWHRESKRYDYYYSAQETELELTYPLSRSDGDLRLTLKRGLKSEAKDWFEPGSDPHIRKSLDRLTAEAELALVSHPDEKSDYLLGVGKIFRRSEYSYEIDESIPAPLTVEGESPDTLRSEWVVQAVMNEPVGENRWQAGLYYNLVYLDRDSDERVAEIKAQTAWELVLNKGASILFNFSWDIDVQYRDGLSPFRPWGGGDVQFLAVF